MSKLVEYVNILKQGKAFVQFERSLEDDEVVSGYVPVKSTLEVMNFLRGAISTNTTQSRAVICWGNYGTGKSRLCTVVARLFKDGCDSRILQPIWDRLIARGEAESVNQLKQTMMPAGRIWRPWLVVPIFANGGGGTLSASLIYSLLKSIKRVGLEDNVLGKTIYHAASIRLDEIVPNNEDYKPIENSRYETKEQLRRALAEDFDEQALKEFSELHKQLTHNVDFRIYLQGLGGVAMTAHDVYNTVSENIKQFGYDGIIVIWDEFGFAIEQLLSHRGNRDLGQETMDLQNFIEQSCGGNHLSRKVVFMGFTHVSLSEYGTRENISQADENRLSTISGRFRDPAIHIYLGVTESEGYHLIAGMINRTNEGQQLFANPIVHLQYIAERMPKFRFWCNLSANLCYDNIVAPCYPSHPAATTALLLLSDQIAQLNRTTFYYLQNETSGGASGHIINTDMPPIDKIGGPELLRVHNLFSFFEDAIKENKQRMYEQYEEAITLHPEASDLEIKILRTVLILMVIANPDMSPTSNFLCFCLCDAESSESNSSTILEALKKLSIVNALWKNDATNVWSFLGARGVNSEIEKSIEDGKDIIAKKPASELIRQYPQIQDEIFDLLGDRDLDPCGTGVIRRVSIKILNIGQGCIEEVNPAKDGSVNVLWRSALIYLVALDTDTQLTFWRNYINKFSEPNVYFVLPQSPLDIDSEKLRTLLAVQNLLKETQPENHAYDVLEGKLTSLRKEIKKGFAKSFGNEGLRTGTEIIKSGESPMPLPCSSWDELLLSLPEELDAGFGHKITVRCGTFNEWHNGTQWGPIKRIVEHILKLDQTPEWRAEYLGFPETSQEAAIIDGVLIENKFLTHKAMAEQWELITVDDRCLSEILQEIRKHLQTGGTEGRAFVKLYSKLIDQPYGVPNGIIPILLALVLRTDGQRVAIYCQESGGRDKRVQTSDLPDELVAMVRKPKRYTTRYEKLSGKYRNVFKAIGPELGILNSNVLGEEFYEFCKQIRTTLKNWISKLPDVKLTNLSEKQRALVKILRSPVPPQLNVLAEHLVDVIEEDRNAKNELSNACTSYPRTERYWNGIEEQINRYVEGVKAPIISAVRNLFGSYSESESIPKQLISFIESIESLDVNSEQDAMFKRIISGLDGHKNKCVYEGLVSAICNKSSENLTEEDYGKACGILQMLNLFPKKKSSKLTDSAVQKENKAPTSSNPNIGIDTSQEQDSNLNEHNCNEHAEEYNCNEQQKVEDVEPIEQDNNLNEHNCNEHAEEYNCNEQQKVKDIEPLEQSSNGCNEIETTNFYVIAHSKGGDQIEIPVFIHSEAGQTIKRDFLLWQKKFFLTQHQLAALILEEIYSNIVQKSTE